MFYTENIQRDNAKSKKKFDRAKSINEFHQSLEKYFSCIILKTIHLLLNH